MAAAPAEDPPRILTAGGLDPCGGAGITADARVASARGVAAATVATCLTVQNRHGLTGLEVVGEPLLLASLAAVRDDGPIAAVKLGLVGAARTLDLVLEFVAGAWPDVPVVVDPVLSATSGGLTTGEDLVAAYRRALPVVTLITPNRPEAERLAPEGVEDLVGRGCAVLLKGGHLGEDDEDADPDMLVDQLWTAPDRTTVFRHPRLDLGPVHGTGCALATAITAGLAAGEGIERACQRGIEYVGRCLLRTPRGKDGLPAPLAIGAWPPGQ